MICTRARSYVNIIRVGCRVQRPRLLKVTKRSTDAISQAAFPEISNNTHFPRLHHCAHRSPSACEEVLSVIVWQPASRQEQFRASARAGQRRPCRWAIFCAAQHMHEEHGHQLFCSIALSSMAPCSGRSAWCTGMPQSQSSRFQIMHGRQGIT